MKECECGGELFPMDTEDHDCKCGQTYCGECDAEYSKEGEKLSGGRIMNKIATCLNCSERLTTMNADAHNCEGEK